MRSHRKNWVGLNRGCYLGVYMADGQMRCVLQGLVWTVGREKERTWGPDVADRGPVWKAEDRPQWGGGTVGAKRLCASWAVVSSRTRLGGLTRM